MIQVIAGKKGSGKTKRIIDLANQDVYKRQGLIPTRAVSHTGDGFLMALEVGAGTFDVFATPPQAPIKRQRGSSGGRGASKPAYRPLIR